MSLTTLNTTMKKSVVMSVINSDFHIMEVNKSNDLCYTRPQNESAIFIPNDVTSNDLI